MKSLKVAPLVCTCTIGLPSLWLKLCPSARNVNFKCHLRKVTELTEYMLWGRSVASSKSKSLLQSPNKYLILNMVNIGSLRESGVL